MSVIAILDPRYKMRAIDFTFSGMYSDRKTRENTIKVWEVPYEIYEEYLCEYQYGNKHSAEIPILNGNVLVGMKKTHQVCLSFQVMWNLLKKPHHNNLI